MIGESEEQPPHYLNGDRVWYIELGRLRREREILWPGVVTAIFRTSADDEPPDPMDDVYNVLLVENGEMKREVCLWNLAPRRVTFPGDDDLIQVPTT